MIGHLMAAAGAVECVATVLSVATNILPPTINYEVPDPECPLDYVAGGMERVDVRAALSNSFGFGGGNACLVVSKYQGDKCNYLRWQHDRGNPDAQGHGVKSPLSLACRS
jgi:3-oxoacyl-[acyl-carrier-protein] synthase II